MRNYLEVEPIETNQPLAEEVRDLENKAEKVTDPNFEFKYISNDSFVTFKVGDECRVIGKTENGALIWDNRHKVDAFYTDINDPKKILLIEINSKKPDGFIEKQKLPVLEFLNFAFGAIGEQGWTLGREYDPRREAIQPSTQI